MTPFDAQERARLCDLLVQLGPDAPTLCEGWTTADLAAHLVIRERRPQAGPGLLLGGRFQAITERVQAQEKARGYDAVVERIRTGPPPIPWRVPGLRTLVNLQEYFIHHEDVRRANGGVPRAGIEELHDAMWRILRRGAGLQLRKLRGYGASIARPEGGVVQVRSGEASVCITGEPGEIVLYLAGRKRAAAVELTGDAAAVAALGETALGL